MGKLPCPLGWDFLFPEHRCQGGTSGPGRSGSTLGTGGMISGSCLLAFVACATETLTFARTQVLVAEVAGISLLPTHDPHSLTVTATARRFGCPIKHPYKERAAAETP